MIEKIHKSISEWKKTLLPNVFQITRQGGTEPAFDNTYWNNDEEGIYECSNCHLPLFSSKDKFESGTGWPSFSKPIVDENVTYRDDLSFGFSRRSAECSRCDAHLGHVFEDGPKPSGLRFCMNSASLIFVPDKN